MTPKEAAEIAFSMREQAPKIGIIGGAEDSGLLNDEVNQLDYAVTIPTAEFKSLNLAMAMSIALYEFFQIFNQELSAKVQTDFNDILATPDELKITENVVGEFLGNIDFFKAENSDANYVTISRLMKKMSLTNQENRYFIGSFEAFDISYKNKTVNL